MRPRATAAAATTGSGIFCDTIPFSLSGSSTSLKTSQRSACGRRMKNLPLSQFDFAQNLAAVRMRPQDEELAALAADIDLAIGKHGRRFLNGAQVLLPKLVARFDIESKKAPVVVETGHELWK